MLSNEKGNFAIYQTKTEGIFDKSTMEYGRVQSSQSQNLCFVCLHNIRKILILIDCDLTANFAALDFP